MRLELPRYTERFGSVLFYDVQKIYEIDSGMIADEAFSSPFHVIRQITPEQLHQLESDMAIVIPIRNERLRLLEGVLCGIPHACVPIIVSNSQRDPIDRFRMEQNVADTFCNYAKKRYVIAHQRDPGIAQLFQTSGYSDLLDEDGLVRNGKSEGMLIGILMARLMGKKYIGFVDSDNYFPGSVLEYVRIFAAGLSQSPSPYAMVRILWHSKPKIRGAELFFSKWGRVSRISNDYLNRFISQYTGFETDVVKTGNAGEHAMTMDLALAMDYSAGFSIETNHFINLMEKFGGILPNATPDIIRAGVHLYQIESRNPHLHDGKEAGHLEEMIHASLGVIYHSALCTDSLKEDILKVLFEKKAASKAASEPALPLRYPAIGGFDFEQINRRIDWNLYGNFQHH